MGPPLQAGVEMAEYGLETSTIVNQEKGQKSTNSRKIDAYSFLGPTRPNTVTLS